MSSKRSTKKESEGDSIAGIGNYVFQKTVGEGNFAKVKLSKHKLTGAEVAIKVIDKTTLDEKKLNKLYREVRIMKLLHHPNIVKLYEVIETKNTLFLVMEYSNGGELYDYLVVHGKMKEKDARAKFRQILSAVSYCHKKRVIHRDLKAENLLLDSNLDIKIADFGFSNHFDPDSKLDTFCGSPPYAAPELFQGRRYTGPEVDIWSLGVILYVLTTGCLPFDGKNLQEMRESVCRGKYRIPFYLSDTCEKLLRKFLIRDPYKRSTLDVLIDDPWINEGYDTSPIKADMSEKVEHDESIVKLIEKRFKVDRDTIMQSLNEGAYDDIAACYYVMYFEKDTRAKIENEVKTLSASGSGSLLVSSPGTAIAKEISPKDGASPTRTAVVQKQSAKKGAEEEDEGPAELPPVSSKPKAASPRKRRQTVGGDDFGKLEAEEDEKKAASALKKMQVNDMTAKEPAPPAAGKPVIKPLPTTAKGPPPAKSAAVAAASKAAPTPAPAPADEEEGDGDKIAPIAGGEDSANGAQGRKRHNTIVGIFRNPLRRPSEVGQAPAPASPTPVEKFPDSNNQEEPDQPDQPGEPRSLRFTFNSNSTSTKPPEDIINEVVIACKKHLVVHKVVSKYVVECNMAGAAAAENVKFEIEVCKLPRLKNLHGLRFKRLAGSSGEYKEICEKILNSAQLV